MRNAILVASAAAAFAGWMALLAGATLAKDMLPLAVGVYVDESVPCKDAAQSQIAAYMGGDGGVNIPPTNCKFVQLGRSGSTYHLKQSCNNTQADATSDYDLSFQAPDTKTLVIDGTKFRCCGTEDEFQADASKSATNQPAAAKATSAARDFCGTITSLSDAWIVSSKNSKIYFAGDDSAPPDPKGVYAYLNAKHSDSDHGCYCITGSVASQRFGTKNEQRFTRVDGLKTCKGSVLR